MAGNGDRWLFLETFGDTAAMEKQEHAARLRRAIAAADIDQDTISEATGRGRRTITNWTSRTSPTMPSDRERAILRTLVGDYDNPGDPVEIALRNSDLDEWRQDLVLSSYKRNLQEQRNEQAAEPAVSVGRPNLRSVAKPGGLEPEDGDLNAP